mgnify:CR=1 FL=1
MESSFYHFKALTHILNVNQIHVSSGEFKILLEALQKGNLSEVKESLAVAVTSSADLLAVLLKASPEQPEIRICTEK